MKSLVITFFLTIILTTQGHGASLGEQEKQYLQENSQSLELEEKDFSLLKGHLENNSIFLAGKNHGLKYNTELQMSLLKFLHQEAGVKYLLIEATFATGELLNRYLESGEEEDLELVISYWRRSREKFDFFQKLREYNADFPLKEQIRVIGGDVQGPPRTLISIKYLGDLLGENHIPLNLEYFLLPLASLAEDFEELRLNPEHHRKAQTEYRAGIPVEMLEKAKEVSQAILQSWEKDPAPYEEFLDNPAEFFLVLNNIKDAFIMEEKLQEGMEASHQFRSERAFDNFTTLMKKYEGEKFFGQWEELNVFQKPYRGVERLGAKLAGRKSPFFDRVLSIWYVYYGSYQMQPFSPGKIVEFDSKYIFQNLDELVDLSRANLTLFQLMGPDSPFTQEEYFLEEENDWASSDFFQFLLLIKDSPPTKPFYKP